MEAFFLAAAMHPESQKAAQAELDAIVGPDRLPEFSDYDHLPYMRAFVKELTRWHVSLPMGLPHATVDNDASVKPTISGSLEGLDGGLHPNGPPVSTIMQALDWLKS